ncbi:MAG: (2Fe-2S)-binding protein [Polyangiaceae bacterium]|nr:(2Fe-2S)-binding protein [Polyangiaceae bacterium]
MVTLTVNGESRNIDADPDMPLLWALRDLLALTGTKFGCGMGQCGACTVHIDGVAARSCLTPISEAAGKKVTTIEGLPADHPLFKAWVAEQVSQCGYCQPGQIMTAASLLQKNPKPTAAEIEKAMDGNLCRCGTYNRIRKAVQIAAGEKP